MPRKVSEASDGQTVAVSADALDLAKGKLDATANDGSGKILLERVKGRKNTFLLISYPGRKVLPNTFLVMTYAYGHVTVQRGRKARRAKA